MTAEGLALTQLHQRQQSALQLATTRDIARMWGRFNVSSFESIESSWPSVADALSALVRLRFRDSVGLASAYYQRFRKAEGVSGLFVPKAAAPLAQGQVDTSLRITGEFVAKHLLAFKAPDVKGKTLVSVSGSAGRLVQSGGRGTLQRSIAEDPKALGYARVTSSGACAFCKMLASRGAVYKSARSAGDGHRYHDHDACTTQPVFSRDTDWPGKAESAQLSRLWQESTRGLSGKDAQTAFRKALAEQRAPAAPAE